MTKKIVTYHEVISMARRLTTLEKIRLIEQLAPEIASDMRRNQPHESLLGLCTDLGPAPTAEEIDQVRREMWATFPRDDI